MPISKRQEAASPGGDPQVAGLGIAEGLLPVCSEDRCRALLDADPDPCFLIVAGARMLIEGCNAAGLALLARTEEGRGELLGALGKELARALPTAAAVGRSRISVTYACGAGTAALDGSLSKTSDASRFVLRLVAPLSAAAAGGDLEDAGVGGPLRAMLIDPLAGRIEVASPALAAALGFDAQALRGMPVERLVGAVFPEAWKDGLQDGAGRSSRFECGYRRQDGASEVLATHCLPFDLNGRALVLCILAGRGAENELAEVRQSKERYEGLFAESAEGIWRFALDTPVSADLPPEEQVRLCYERGYLAECNSAMARMYGLEAPADLVGARLGDLLPPDDPWNADYLLRFVANGYRMHQAESHELARDGSPRSFLNSATGIMENGLLVGAWGTQIDITEQRLAEKALRESEGRLQEMVNTMHEGLLVIDADRCISFANPSAGRILGVPPEALPGRNLVDLIAPGQEEVLEEQRTLRTRGLPSTYELLLRRPDGAERAVMVHSTPRPFMEGEFRGAYLILHDVTDTRRMERELAQSQVRLSALLDQLRDVVVYETGPGLRYISPSLREILGYDPSEMEALAHDFSALTHTEDRANYDEAEAAWREEGAPGVLVKELRWRHKDGHWVWLEDRMLLAEAPGGGLIRRGVMIDVSERKAIEQAVEESEGRYREMMERTSDAVVRTGPDGVIIYANPVARNILGLQPGAGILDAATRLAGESKLSSLVGNALALSRSHTPTWSFQLEMTDTGGERRFFDWTCVFFYGSGGETLRADFIGRDLTRQRMLMRQMLERQKDESIAAMAGGIAHDFNNILTSILGSVSLLDGGVEAAGASELIQGISTGARQMAGLTSRLLAYSKSGPRELAEMDVSDGVRDTLQMLRPIIGAKSRLQVELDRDELVILGDPTEFNQVVLNLVVNAHEATDQDGGRIVVQTRGVTLADWDCPLHGAHPGGAYVVLEVSDNGAGIDEALLGRIFEPYFSTKFQGRGLGLAAVAGIIAAMGGCIEVRSEPGRGSTFTVLLPRLAQRASRRPVAPSLKTARCGGRVLLIEDEETVRFVASRVLKRAGYEVEAAVDGVEGLALLRAAPEPFDLILADAKMPRLGGIELAAQLAEAGSAVPLMLCTGYAPAIHHKQAGEPPEALSLPGVSRLMLKPYTGEELIAAVAEVLEGGNPGTGAVPPPGA